MPPAYLAGGFPYGRQFAYRPGCSGKIRMETRAIAEAVVRRHKRHEGSRRRIAASEIYLCPHCHGWHVGSKTPWTGER